MQHNRRTYEAERRRPCNLFQLRKKAFKEGRITLCPACKGEDKS